MTKALLNTSQRYDSAAPKWSDKMRTLGYYDGYLGFLTTHNVRSQNPSHIIDVGSGTAAFSEAWVAVNGPPLKCLTLLDPSLAMLERGKAALNARGVEPNLVQAILGETHLETADHILAAHVIEHCPDPLDALKQVQSLLRPGGTLHLVVSKPHWCNALIWFQWRHRTFGEAEILSLLASAGFNVEEVYSFPSGPPSRTSRGIVATKNY